jgi:NADH:flavin oxidoreductase / NADH oxidase family
MTTPVVLCPRWVLFSTLMLFPQPASPAAGNASRHLRNLLTIRAAPVSHRRENRAQALPQRCGGVFHPGRHLVDGLAFGFHNLGEPMTLGEFRKVFHGPLIGNCGYTKETAETAISERHADLIAFGRPYISNPDLVERFRNDWPLAELAPMSDWYSPSGGKGYTDFPQHEPRDDRSFDPFECGGEV